MVVLVDGGIWVKGKVLGIMAGLYRDGKEVNGDDFGRVV